MKNIIISDNIEFPTIERFDVNKDESIITDYIEVSFKIGSQESENHILIVSDTFKNWFRDQTSFQYWDFRRLFAVESRDYLKGYIFNYIQKEVFHYDQAEEQRTDCLMQEIEDLRKELEKYKALAVTENKMVYLPTYSRVKQQAS